MDEYIFKVIIGGEKDDIKVFASNIIEAIDSIIAIDSISELYFCFDVEKNIHYDLNNFDLTDLRTRRNQVKSEKELTKSLRNLSKKEIKKITEPAEVRKMN
jgi:hypothetical protein